VAKITLQEFPPMTLALLRFSLASLLLAPFFLAETKKVKILESTPIVLQITQPIGELPNHEKSKIQPEIGQQIEEEKPQQPLENKEINFIELDGLIIKRNGWAIPWWLLIIFLLLPALFYTKITKTIRYLLKTKPIFKLASKKSSLKRLSVDFEKIKQNQKPEQLYSFFLKFLAVKFAGNISRQNSRKTCRFRP